MYVLHTLNIIFFRFCDLGLANKEIPYDTENWIDILRYSLSQLVYTVMTNILAFFMYSNVWVNRAFLTVAIMYILWNGKISKTEQGLSYVNEDCHKQKIK